MPHFPVSITSKWGCLTAALLSLGACGGGAGGSQIASIPAPPAPPASATPPPPLQPAHIGLVSASPFITLGIGDTYSANSNGGGELPLTGPDRSQSVQFTYVPSSDTYQISLPNFETGKLVTQGLNGSSGQVATGTFNKVTLGSSQTLQSVGVNLPVPGSNQSPYNYTSFASWAGSLGQVSGRNTFSEGYFAYGIPTKTGDVPITGTGTYNAQILGSSGRGEYFSIEGDVSMSFDFAAGTLSGAMHPVINYNGFDTNLDFGKYDFTQTIYSRGATNFSGAFIVPGMPEGTSQSFFEGAFTGPGAAELLARFQAPYLLNGQTGMLSGVWIGKNSNSVPVSVSH